MGPEKKSPLLDSSQRSTSGRPGQLNPIDEELLARIESLEARVDVLETRKKYNREYMREKRAGEKKDG